LRRINCCSTSRRDLRRRAVEALVYANGDRWRHLVRNQDRWAGPGRAGVSDTKRSAMSWSVKADYLYVRLETMNTHPPAVGSLRSRGNVPVENPSGGLACTTSFTTALFLFTRCGLRYVLIKDRVPGRGAGGSSRCLSSHQPGIGVSSSLEKVSL